VSALEAREVREREALTWFWDDDGSLVIRGRLAPEYGVLLLQALEAARERLWKHAESDERGSADAGWRPSRVGGGARRFRGTATV
jgi:hypothetical protein